MRRPRRCRCSAFPRPLTRSRSRLHCPNARAPAAAPTAAAHLPWTPDLADVLARTGFARGARSRFCRNPGVPMNSMKLCAVAAAVAALVPAARAADAAPPPDVKLDEVTVTGTANKLDMARNQLSPETGSTIYRFNKEDIDALPLGSATPLNQVLLQSPGTAQDSFGQLHLRGDHANLQYRINGILIPE